MICYWITNWYAFPWGKLFFFFTLNIPWLPVVLCVGLRSCGLSLSLVYFGISIVVFVQLKFMQSCWRDFMGVVSHFLS